MNNCYDIKLHNSVNNPLLNSINKVYYLIMDNSNNLKTRQPELFTLGKNFYIQYNKGYKKCNKNKNIDNSNLDIVDAYKNICKLNEHNKENIIILEEDAFIIEFDKIIYNEIDNFIQHNNFDIYTFGSGGIFKQHLKTNHGKLIYKGLKILNSEIIFPFFAAQAVILSPNVRNKILNLNINNLSKKFHIDTTFTYAFDLNIFTYKKPLIVQCFSMSKNQKQWDHSNGLASKIIKVDKENFKNLKNGWNLIYFFNYNIVNIIIFIISIIILSIIILLVYKYKN